MDTAGKAVFTERFAWFLESTDIKNAVLHMDDFHNPADRRRAGANEIEAYYQNAFDYEKVRTEILDPLRRDGTLDRDVLCLSLDTDRYEVRRRFSVGADTVLLIEGVLLFREPLLPYFDGTIFYRSALTRCFDAPVSRRYQYTAKRYIDQYIPVQRRYLEECDPARRCDVVIDNGDDRSPKIISRIRA